MIGDDQVDSGAPRRFGGGEPADAGVNADDQPRALGSSPLDHLVAHAIAFTDAVRKMKAARSAAKLARPLEDADRRRAVPVIVAVNKNFFSALYRGLQPIKSGF